MRLLDHIALLFSTLPLLAQSNTGELRLKVTDPAGLSLKATVELSSDSTQFRRDYQSDDAGILIVRNLPFGLYRLHVEHEGFSSYEGRLETRSALPTDYLIKPSIAAMSTAINVTPPDPRSRSPLDSSTVLCMLK